MAMVQGQCLFLLSKPYIIHQAAFTFMLVQSLVGGWKSQMIACVFSLTFPGTNLILLLDIFPIKFLQLSCSEHTFILGIKATFETLSEQNYNKLEISINCKFDRSRDEVDPKEFQKNVELPARDSNPESHQEPGSRRSHQTFDGSFVGAWPSAS
jgi:hypothetical protein